LLIDDIKNSFSVAAALLDDFCSDKTNFELLTQLAYGISDSFTKKQKIIICGNGGSNADAIHFAEEFTGQFRDKRPALPVIALSDASHITCVGNDMGFDSVFQRGVEAYGLPGDWFIGLSTSGNSQNVLAALNQARKMGLTTLALLGKDGGMMRGIAEYEFIIPGATSDRIQEIHMLILHSLIEAVERVMFPENYTLAEVVAKDNISA